MTARRRGPLCAIVTQFLVSGTAVAARATCSTRPGVRPRVVPDRLLANRTYAARLKPAGMRASTILLMAQARKDLTPRTSGE